MRDVVLIHGAGGQRGELAPLAAAMGDGFTYWSLDLLGHGGRPIPAEYGVPQVAADLIEGLDSAKVERPLLVGYSFGGYIALYLASRFPDRVAACCTIGTRYFYDAKAVDQALRLLDPDRAAYLRIKVPPWLAAIHAKHRELLLDSFSSPPPLSEADLRSLEVPVLALNGDRDFLVTAEETLQMADLVPRSRSAVFQGPAHPFRKLPLSIVSELIREFAADVESGWQVPTRRGTLRDLGAPRSVTVSFSNPVA